MVCDRNLKEVSPGRTDAKAEVPKLWPPDAKSRLIGKDPGSGKDLRAGGEESDKG